MDTYLALLNDAAQHEAAAPAFTQAHTAIARLRFHEGLRRRWENARAEAAVREAAALSLLEGARTSVNDLRALSMTTHHTALTPGEAYAVGIWRAQWNMASELPALNTRQPHAPTRPQPWPAKIASYHRDATSALAHGGYTDPHTIAIPHLPSQVSLVIAAATATQRGSLGAWAAAGDIWARMRIYDIFTPASGAVGATLARWLLITRGVEPTGVAVISAWHTINTTHSAAALNAWQAAQNPNTPRHERVELLAQWLGAFAQGVEYGAHIGADIALSIQAGRLSGGLE